MFFMLSTIDFDSLVDRPFGANRLVITFNQAISLLSFVVFSNAATLFISHSVPRGRNILILFFLYNLL